MSSVLKPKIVAVQDQVGNQRYYKSPPAGLCQTKSNIPLIIIHYAFNIETNVEAT